VTALANRQLRLIRRPARSALADEDFGLEEGPAPKLELGELLVRVDFLGFDPAQRGWLREGASYVEPVRIGEVMRASGAGEVIVSRNEDWPLGARVTGMFGWQELALCDGRESLWRVPDDISLADALGVLGTTGMTAYFGVIEVGRVGSGDVVLVSAAAGATGSVAGQVARLRGASRVIGIAGGPEKCTWLTEVAGFDAAIDYKDGALAERIGEAAPAGVDVFYDNVGGEVLDAGLLHLARGARIVVCGAISTRYSTTGEQPPAVRNLEQLLLTRSRMEGFIVLDFASRHEAARNRLAAWLRDGEIVAAVDLVRGGIEKAPATLRRLFEGRNLGKQLLEIH
jgi:hypothetical protein